MDDLISRKVAIMEIEDYIEEYSELDQDTGYHNLKWCAMEEAKDVLTMLPTVDAAPIVHGRWIEFHAKAREYGKVYYQHDCTPILYESPYKYCPNCGAKMDEELRSE